MVRAKPKELQYYGVFLIIPFLVTLIALILQMSQKYDIFDPTDWYLFGVSLGLLAVIVNLFLFVYEINRYGGHRLISTSKLCEENVVWIVMNWKINIKHKKKLIYYFRREIDFLWYSYHFLLSMKSIEYCSLCVVYKASVYSIHS